MTNARSALDHSLHVKPGSSAADIALVGALVAALAATTSLFVQPLERAIALSPGLNGEAATEVELQPVVDTWVLRLEGSNWPPSEPHSADAVLTVAEGDVTPAIAVALIRFDIGAAVSAEDEIATARLMLYRGGYCVSPHDDNVRFCATAIVEDWQADLLDGYNTPAHAQECWGAAYPVESPSDWIAWDITGLVKQWQDGTPNYGLLLGVADQRSPMHCTCHFYSMEGAHPPRLMLTVSDPSLGTATATATQSTRTPTTSPEPTRMATATATRAPEPSLFIPFAVNGPSAGTPTAVSPNLFASTLGARGPCLRCTSHAGGLEFVRPRMPGGVWRRVCTVAPIPIYRKAEVRR